MESEIYNNSFSNQLQHMFNNSFLEMRLSNKELLEKIEYFLSARRSVMKQDKNGKYYQDIKQIGFPLANEDGINNILQMITLRTDPHVVQGNFKEDHYWDFIKRTRQELTIEVIMNCYEWGIKDNKIGLIIDTIMGFIEPYMSRCIDNEERKSYMQQFISRETISQKPRGALESFGGNMGGNNR